ncbi:MAG: ABC transporter substrate-binding protein [Actinomycetota bacterium]
MNAPNGQDRLFGRLLALAFALTLAFGVLIAHYYDRLGSSPAQVATGTGTSGGDGTSGNQQSPGDGAGGTAAATPGQNPTSVATSTTTKTGGTTTGKVPTGTTRGVSKGSIKVGGIFSITGPFDASPARDSTRAYFQLINSEGGVNGRTLEYISYDDAFDPTQGQNAARKLIEQDKVFAIVGWLAPNSEPAASQYFAKVGLPVVGGLAVPQEFGPRNFFATMANLGKAGAAVARFPCDAKVKKPAVGIVDLPFADQMMAAVRKGLAQCGVTDPILTKIASTSADYTQYILEWRSKGADSIGAALDPMGFVKLMQALDRQSWHPPTWLVGSADSERNAMVKNALEGAFSVESQLVATLHTDLPGPRRYVETMHKYYPGTTIASTAQISWTAAQVFVEGLRRAGPDPTWQKVIEAIETLRDFKTDLTAPLTYTATDHDAIKCIELLQWKNGAWTDYYPDFQCWEYTSDGGTVVRPSRPFT